MAFHRPAPDDLLRRYCAGDLTVDVRYEHPFEERGSYFALDGRGSFRVSTCEVVFDTAESLLRPDLCRALEQEIKLRAGSDWHRTVLAVEGAWLAHRALIAGPRGAALAAATAYGLRGCEAKAPSLASLHHALETLRDFCASLDEIGDDVDLANRMAAALQQHGRERGMPIRTGVRYGRQSSPFRGPWQPEVPMVFVAGRYSGRPFLRILRAGL